MQNLKYFLFFGCLYILVSCKNSKKNGTQESTIKNGFTINGFNYTSADSIYLYDKNHKVLQRAKIIDKKISLKGKIDTPTVTFLKLNTKGEFHPIILENQEYNLLFSNFETTIFGGNFHQKYTDYQSIRKNTSLTEKERSNSFYKFIKDNNSNLLSKYIIEQEKLSSYTIGKIQNEIKNSTNSKLLTYLEDLKERTIKEEAIAKIENRPIAKDFSGTNIFGRITSLAKVKSGKKAVLIDFWASWCGPCRELSPRIKNLYDTYKSKGFDIVTVSQDRSINAWEAGVYEDGMENWNHVYDDDNDIAKMYGVRGIPHMVLLDDKGRIIKNKIPIDMLEEELARIFKN